MLLPVGIALGSNQGDRAAELEAGFAFLQTLSADGAIRRSSVIESQPLDCPPGTASFLNAVAEITVNRAALSPADLLARLQDFEVERGRPRAHLRHSPRPLDLDILYFGEVVLHLPDLVLPHPGLLTRRFVLEPLAELRPELILPGQTRPLRDILAVGA